MYSFVPKNKGTQIQYIMKKIALINGHPNHESFNFALAEAYKKGVENSGAEIKEIIIRDLDFNPNLQFGYQKRMDLEPDLLKAWEIIQCADHLVWVHPVWWGGLPAITKGFIDRLFLPGLAFKYRENSVWWDKFLKGKTAHIITTIDQPGWYYRIFYGRPSINQLKKSTLEFCGVKPVKVTYIGIIKNSKEEQRQKWIEKVYSLGQKLK
ncbi:Putative NADPH-quinone reductase (modulator of drug activity B) [Chryseobacterium indoltheticum]|uniref:NADPH-quinone reductase (Modulator of drug activity B) n=2 Tax=Chryseobacterium indoltheticum TaxID=254 RepID=A0A381FGB6_9FLAO|nr:Putative NADPH-quinone reductase (modulator of drug activity B) [Chryseobacterium indoltheticum]